MLHPHPPNFHLLQTYSSLSPPPSKNSPVPVEWLVLCGPSTVPFLSLLWRVTPVPLAPAPLPGPYRNALGLVIAFVGAIELYGWLKLPNLTARWPLNGAQRGAALQTTAAAKFLQWRSTITPTQAQIYRQAGGTGKGRGGGGRDVVVMVVSVWVCWAERWKSLHLTPNNTATFCVIWPLRMDMAQTLLGGFVTFRLLVKVKQLFMITISQIWAFFHFNISPLVKKFQCRCYSNNGEIWKIKKIENKKRRLNAGQSLKIKQFLITFRTFVLRFGALGLCAGI